MSTYRLVWHVLVAVLGGLGAVVALLAIEGGVVFSLVALAGVITAALHHALAQAGVRWLRREDRLTFVAVGMGVAVALAGYIELSGPVWIPGALLLAALSPAVLCGLAPLFRCLPAIAGYLTDPHTTDHPAVSDGPGPSSADGALDFGLIFRGSASTMTMTELCTAWRASFLALCGLRDGRDPEQHALLVNSRQQYLDELETRDPVGFSRWLAAGAGPGSNPGRYLKSVDKPRT